MSQPDWEFVANLGDKNPIDYGGFFVFRDKTGVYDIEAEVLIAEELSRHEAESMKWTVYRIMCERCYYNPETKILSDNRFHKDHSAWFAKPESERVNRPQDSTYLSNMLSTYGIEDEAEFIKDICGDNATSRAWAYKMIAEYHGYENFDSYPLSFTNREEVETRYKDILPLL